ncbi:hypothetical protein D3C72_1883760 [compost metagenome]
MTGDRGDDEGRSIGQDRPCFRLGEQIVVILETDEGAPEAAEAEHVDFLEAHDDVVEQRQPG